jgi:hypothetical protein
MRETTLGFLRYFKSYMKVCMINWELTPPLLASLVRGYVSTAEQLSRVQDMCWVASSVRFAEIL